MDDFTIDDLNAARERAAAMQAALGTFPDDIIGRSDLKELSGMLAFVNYVFFAVTSWIAFASLAPTLNNDDRPAWFMWLIGGPMVGAVFGGPLGIIAWQLFANWVGQFVYKRRGELWYSVWWRRYVGEDNARF